MYPMCGFSVLNLAYGSILGGIGITLPGWYWYRYPDCEYLAIGGGPFPTKEEAVIARDEWIGYDY